MEMAATEAGHMSAPDDALESASKSLLRKGRVWTPPWMQAESLDPMIAV